MAAEINLSQLDDNMISIGFYLHAAAMQATPPMRGFGCARLKLKVSSISGDVNLDRYMTAIPGRGVLVVTSGKDPIGERFSGQMFNAH